ncbi:MAG: DUF3039 domain-containing protein [Ancrocorticia sp.]
MSRTARPTLRVIREDLTSGWSTPYFLRMLDKGEVSALHPFPSLPHPLIARAADSFGEEPQEDHHEGPVRSAGKYNLKEIKDGQWRGGVWAQDEVCWLVVAGLAKGEHKDHDDFYKKVERLSDERASEIFRPTEEDIHLWRREVAATKMSEWDLRVQRLMTDLLERALSVGSSRLEIKHPLPEKLPNTARLLATVELEVKPIREPDYEYDDVLLTIEVADRWLSSDFAWHFIIRALTIVNPPEQDWDRFGNDLSTMAEPGVLAKRLTQLRELNSRQELAQSEPGIVAHFVHKPTLTKHSYKGTATQAACGVIFVPRQDHEALPVCPECENRMKLITLSGK